MAIVIEQSDAEVRLAFEVHQNAEIALVRLASANLRSRELELSDDPDKKIRLMFGFRPKQVPAPRSVLRIEVKFVMRGFIGGLPASKNDKPAIFVECVYEADYRLQPDFDLTPKHVTAFQNGNAIFNVWPYFREFLQSHMSAMALPPLTAPFLRMQPKPVATKPATPDRHSPNPQARKPA